LLRDSTPAIVKRDIELHGLASPQRGQTIRELFRHLQKIVAMNKEVAVKRSCIQKTPTLCKTPNVTTMALTEAILRISAQKGFQSGRVWSSMVIRLNIELQSLPLVKGVPLEFWHDSFSAEDELPFEHVAFDESPTVCMNVLRNSSLQPLMLQIHWLLRGHVGGFTPPLPWRRR
jgi:hypothetical protein